MAVDKKAIAQKLDKLMSGMEDIKRPKPQKIKGEIETWRPKPSLYLTNEDFEGVGELKAGEEVLVLTRCKVISVSKREEAGKKRESAELEIQSINIV